MLVVSAVRKIRIICSSVNRSFFMSVFLRVRKTYHNGLDQNSWRTPESAYQNFLRKLPECGEVAILDRRAGPCSRRRCQKAPQPGRFALYVVTDFSLKRTWNSRSLIGEEPFNWPEASLGCETVGARH